MFRRRTAKPESRAAFLESRVLEAKARLEAWRVAHPVLSLAELEAEITRVTGETVRRLNNTAHGMFGPDQPAILATRRSEIMGLTSDACMSALSEARAATVRRLAHAFEVRLTSLAAESKGLDQLVMTPDRRFNARQFWRTALLAAAICEEFECPPEAATERLGHTNATGRIDVESLYDPLERALFPKKPW